MSNKNLASKRSSARPTAFLVQFDPGYDRASWDRVVAIVQRHAGSLNYGTQVARFSADSAAQAACVEARAVGVACRRKGGGKHAKRANPWMPGAYSAGQRYLEAEAAKEYKAQLARHLKSGRAKSTMRYVVPEWQQEMVTALGADDDAQFKGLMMQHRTGAIPLKRNSAKKRNPSKPTASSSYGPVIFANALVYITDAGSNFSIRGPVYQSRTSQAAGGGYVVPDARRGGDKVFPLAGRDVEVYVGDNYDEPVLQYKGMEKLRGNPAEKPRPGGVTPRSERRKNSWFITYAPPATVAPSQSPMAQYMPLVNPRPPGARSSRAKYARSAKKNPSGQEHAEIAVQLLPTLVDAYKAFVSTSSKAGPRQVRALAEALGRVEEHNKYATWPVDAAMGMNARRNVQNYIDSAKSALRSASQTWRSHPRTNPPAEWSAGSGQYRARHAKAADGWYFQTDTHGIVDARSPAGEKFFSRNRDGHALQHVYPHGLNAPQDSEAFSRLFEARSSRSNPITSPNTSGQGYDPDHTASPYHDTLVHGGYVYSHSTPVRAGQKMWIRHAYRLPGTQMVVGVDPHSWEGHRLGSSAARSGRTTADLAKYLKGVLKRAR